MSHFGTWPGNRSAPWRFSPPPPRRPKSWPQPCTPVPGCPKQRRPRKRFSMTAALLLTIEIARKLRGGCVIVDGGVLALDGARHADCSTCHAECGISKDVGLAETGFRIAKSHDGLSLNWECPTCKTSVCERTTIFLASADARAIAADPICVKCRAKSAAHPTE